LALDDLAEAIRLKAEKADKLEAVVKFDLGPDGVVLLDGTSDTPGVKTADGDADVTLAMKTETLRKLLDGSLSPTLAYMTGKLKASGSLTVGMRLATLLDGE
jgi:putative sterol carrier protein